MSLNKRAGCFVTIFLAFMMFAATQLHAEIKLPVNISADSVEHDDATASIIYSGNVKLTQGEISLFCDQLKLVRDQHNNSLITATGNPVLFQQSGAEGSSSGKASVVIYHVKQRLLQLKGEPLQFEHLDLEGNHTSGDALVADYDMHIEHIKMSGSPIHIKHIKKSNDKEPPLRGEARNIDYDMKKERLVMTGNARIEQDDSKVTNDRIIFDLKHMNVVAGKKANARERVHTTIRLEE
ncbi:MAG: LptA/OstA family protein [Pseudomonadota bacterium]|nr:LptA/OstA family protein [Pseudomonadota bacterium]